MTSGTHADLVARLRAIAARFDMTSTERYEQDSEAFYAATGYMAPGKDVPMAMGGQDETERRAAHESWISGRNRSQQRAIQEAAEALAALTPPADPPALVALVREWQQDVENLGSAGPEEDITDQYQKQVWESEARLLAYPLPAAPPVTDTPRGLRAICDEMVSEARAKAGGPEDQLKIPAAPPQEDQ